MDQVIKYVHILSMQCRAAATASPEASQKQSAQALHCPCSPPSSGDCKMALGAPVHTVTLTGIRLPAGNPQLWRGIPQDPYLHQQALQQDSGLPHHYYLSHFFFTYQVMFPSLSLTCPEFVCSRVHPLSFHQTCTCLERCAPVTQKHCSLYFWGPKLKENTTSKYNIITCHRDSAEAGSKPGRRAHGMPNCAKGGL